MAATVKAGSTAFSAMEQASLAEQTEQHLHFLYRDIYKIMFVADDTLLSCKLTLISDSQMGSTIEKVSLASNLLKSLSGFTTQFAAGTKKCSGNLRVLVTLSHCTDTARVPVLVQIFDLKKP